MSSNSTWPPIGRTDMGHLRRLEGFSRDFGYKRGTAVDRLVTAMARKMA